MKKKNASLSVRKMISMHDFLSLMSAKQRELICSIPYQETDEHPFQTRSSEANNNEMIMTMIITLILNDGNKKKRNITILKHLSNS